MTETGTGTPAGPPAPSAARGATTGMLGEVLRMAFHSLRAHTLRSLLTTLGVVIGVMTVVAMASIIEGFNQSVSRSINQFGSHVIYVRTFRPGFFVGGFPDSLRHRKAFTPEDARAIREQCPDVAYVNVMSFAEGATVSYRGHTSRGLQVLGSDTQVQYVLKYDPAVGRFFTDEEVQRRAQVMVIGKDIREGLFPRAAAPSARPCTWAGSRS